MKPVLTILTALLVAPLAALHAAETPSERDARMAWWREARFGMFIHWGPSAALGGIWNGTSIDTGVGHGLSEWIQYNAKIPVADYARAVAQFNPVEFDADAWVRLAKEAGQRYVVITAKHHDGFAMFRSAASPFNILEHTRFPRDVMKEVADACRRHGLRLGFYYSQAQDWHHPGGAAYKDTFVGADPAAGRWDKAQDGSFDDYLNRIAVPQVRELLSNYGQVSVLWWDTPVGMTPERARRFAPLLGLQPGIITNNRLLDFRNPNEFSGDTETPEQTIPPTGFKDRDFEVCMTMNDAWGFKLHDQNWKPAADLIRKLVDVASKGGNFLLNVGPDALGRIPQPSVERLQAMGRWTRANGEAIYGSAASPFAKLPWGRCTRRPGVLYLQVFDWPQDGRLVVPGLKSSVRSARLLAGGEPLRVESRGNDKWIHLPATAPDPVASVIRVEIDGPLDVDNRLPSPGADGTIPLPLWMADIHNPGYGAEARLGEDAGAPAIVEWKGPGTYLAWSFEAAAPGSYEIVATLSPAKPGARLRLQIGKESATATLQGDSSPAVLDRLNIPAAGVHELALRPVAAGWQPVVLRSVTLRPSKSDRTSVAPDGRGLVAHWTFDEVGGSVAKDISGNGHDGTIHGAVRTPSPWGQALHFAGDQTYVDVGKAESLNLRGDITIVVRVKADKIGEGYHMIFVDAAETGAKQNYALFLHQGKLVFRNGDGFSPWAHHRTIYSERPFPVNCWQTVVVVFEGSRYWIYWNGVVAEHGETSLPITPTRGGSRQIGGFNGNVKAGFKGEIDDVRLYNRALSHPEVLGLEREPGAAPQMLLKPLLKYSEQKLICEALVLTGLPAGSRLELSARQRQGDRIVGQSVLTPAGETAPASGRWRAEGNLSTADWAAGDIELVLTLRDASGNELARAAATVSYPGPKSEYPRGIPPWLNSKAGCSEQVLPPFTALTATRSESGCRVSPWGRTYEFRQAPFLTQITSQGAPLLAGPMRLLATIDGREVVWTPGSPKLRQTGESVCRIAQRSSSAAADVEVETTVEYDGLAKLDWRLRPRQAASVDRLIVELPFRAEVARLLSTWPRVAPGALRDACASPFQPLVWLGDEERGLQWLCESERNWSVADAERALEIVRQGDTVVLRLNLVTRPVRIEADGVLDYTFGLLASPVKPPGRDAWDARIVRATKWYGKELELPDQKVGDKPVLEYYAEKGARVIMVWFWWDAFAYPLPLGHEERFRRLVRECHRAGLKVIPYVGGFLMSEHAPEAPFFRDEMRVRPMQPYRSTASGHNPMPGWKPQISFFACQRGPWQDFIVDGIARLIDEYDVDGVYLDTTTVPLPCNNGLHGCGYRDANGQTRPAYPVFSVRDNLRRIYTTVRQRKPDGIVDLHIYDCMNLPAMAWATTYWNGEALPRGNQPLIEKLPLDRFRTEFLGANLGVPADLLYYVLKDYPKSVALALLHDVPVRPEQLSDLDRISQLWQVRDEFGVKRARWLPYWRNGDVVQVEPAGCYASLYVHPQGRVLACVSNLGAQAAAVRCRFDLAKVGLGQTAAAWDALSDTPLSFQDGTVTLDLSAGAYRLVRVGERIPPRSDIQ